MLLEKKEQLNMPDKKRLEKKANLIYFILKGRKTPSQFIGFGFKKLES